MSCFPLQGKTAHLVFIVPYTCQVDASNSRLKWTKRQSAEPLL